MLVVIPARAGSKRIPGKALRQLGGKPLIAWAIESALAYAEDNLDVRVVVASEDDDILRAADAYPCEAWLRPLSTASDDAPDITWLQLALARDSGDGLFMVRRPTSPFITPATMHRAHSDFLAVPGASAMRAMRPVSEHPGKMWQRNGPWMAPLFAVTSYGVESRSCPTQVLPRVYVQTAGLEIIRRSTIELGSLTGDQVLPLFLNGREAIDLNTPQDWFLAEQLLKDDQEGGDA